MTMHIDRCWIRIGPVAALALLTALTGCGGCTQEIPPPAVPAASVFERQQQLDRLYLTEKSSQQVVRPGNVSVPFVDEDTGELSWPTLVCTNPACPGRGQDGKPYLFIHRDPLFRVDSDGKVIHPQVGPGQDYSAMVADAGGFPDPTCPACYEAFRKGKTETQEDKNLYASFVQDYVLPETARQRWQLERGAAPAAFVATPPVATSAATFENATPQEREQKAVELARQIKRPILKGGVTLETTEFLRTVLQESDDPRVRAAIIAGLAKARDADSVPQLLDAMEDETLEVRKLAGSALERTCGFPNLFKADAPLEQRREVIARYRKLWDDIVNAPGQHYLRLMKEPGYKEQVGRQAMEKLEALRRKERQQ